MKIKRKTEFNKSDKLYLLGTFKSSWIYFFAKNLLNLLGFKSRLSGWQTTETENTVLCIGAWLSLIFLYSKRAKDKIISQVIWYVSLLSYLIYLCLKRLISESQEPYQWALRGSSASLSQEAHQRASRGTSARYLSLKRIIRTLQEAKILSWLY